MGLAMNNLPKGLRVGLLVTFGVCLCLSLFAFELLSNKNEQGVLRVFIDRKSCTVIQALKISEPVTVTPDVCYLEGNYRVSNTSVVVGGLEIPITNIVGLHMGNR